MSVAADQQHDEEPLPDDAAGEGRDRGYEYRELSGMAIVSIACGALALASLPVISLFSPTWFAALPLIGVFVGLRAWRQIDQSEGDLMGAPIAVAGVCSSAIALAIGWSMMAYIYQTEVPPGHERIQYSQLKLDENGNPPRDVAQLDGQKVFIKGFVYPDKDTVGIKKFILCRDNGDCCFGGSPPLSDMIEVSLSPPQTLTFHTYQFKVSGTFHFRPSRVTMSDKDGAVLYHLDDASFTE